MVSRGGLRNTLDDDLWVFNFFGAEEFELMERERRWSKARLRRARARFAAVASGEGGSPNIKNLMKAPMSMMTDNWPRRNPSVKDSLPSH